LRRRKQVLGLLLRKRLHLVMAQTRHLDHLQQSPPYDAEPERRVERPMQHSVQVMHAGSR
jgi:hypothetical protein